MDKKKIKELVEQIDFMVHDFIDADKQEQLQNLVCEVQEELSKTENTTDFECGQWSVIQNVIGYVKDYSLAAELCREASIGYKKIKILQKDCGYSYKEEINDFLKESRHGGTSLKLDE